MTKTKWKQYCGTPGNYLSNNMLSGLLQDPAEHLEVHLDEVRQPADHWRGAEASHPSRRGLRHGGLRRLISAHCAAWKYIYTLFTSPHFVPSV